MIWCLLSTDICNNPIHYNTCVKSFTHVLWCTYAFILCLIPHYSPFFPSFSVILPHIPLYSSIFPISDAVVTIKSTLFILLRCGTFSVRRRSLTRHPSQLTSRISNENAECRIHLPVQTSGLISLFFASPNPSASPHRTELSKEAYRLGT